MSRKIKLPLKAKSSSRSRRPKRAVTKILTKEEVTQKGGGGWGGVEGQPGTDTYRKNRFSQTDSPGKISKISKAPTDSP